mmetsp:Transcript_6753/g.21402  ORF Transcript_6753/g.21402 Transcript_6753/m.21402 type:complete len:252 (+) Transcript_6753:385-1140(+)
MSTSALPHTMASSSEAVSSDMRRPGTMAVMPLRSAATCASNSCSRSSSAARTYAPRSRQRTGRSAPPGTSGTCVRALVRHVHVCSNASSKLSSSTPSSASLASSRNRLSLSVNSLSTASTSAMSGRCPTSCRHTMLGRSSGMGSATRTHTPIRRPRISYSLRCSLERQAGLGTNLSSVYPTLLSAFGHGSSSGSRALCSSAHTSEMVSRNAPPASMPASWLNRTVNGCRLRRSCAGGHLTSSRAICGNMKS